MGIVTMASPVGFVNCSFETLSLVILTIVNLDMTKLLIFEMCAKILDMAHDILLSTNACYIVF